MSVAVRVVQTQGANACDEEKTREGDSIKACSQGQSAPVTRSQEYRRVADNVRSTLALHRSRHSE
mgnify:FL=1